jgi:hypothetical protein
MGRQVWGKVIHTQVGAVPEGILRQLVEEFLKVTGESEKK